MPEPVYRAIANTLIQSWKEQLFEPLAGSDRDLTGANLRLSGRTKELTEALGCCRGTGARTSSPWRRPQSHGHRRRISGTVHAST